MKRRLLVTGLEAFIRKEYFEPEVTRALKVMTALVGPLLVAHLLGKANLGVFVAITAQLITSARIQGTYSKRALVLLIGTLAVACAAFAGTLSGGGLWTAVIFITLVANIASLARGIGDYGQVFGISAVILFLISLHAPNTLESAYSRSLLILIGGAWSAVLTLHLWPFRPQLPFFLAIAKPWYYCSILTEQVGHQFSVNAENPSAVIQLESDTRKAINSVLPWLQKKQKSTVLIRREALKIVRASSRFGSTMLALHAELVYLRKNELPVALLTGILAALEEIASASKYITNAIIRQKRQLYGKAQTALENAFNKVSSLQKSAEEEFSLPDTNQPIRRVLVLIEAAITYLEDALLMLERMEVNKKQTAPRISRNPVRILRQEWQTIKLQLQPDSILLQHSLRVASMAALGILIYYLFQIPRGYWIVLTVMILLQPDFGSTWEKTRDRLLGTLLGAILGTLLLMIFSTSHFVILISVVAACSFLFVYFQPKNYKVAVVFVTIMLVALLEMAEQIDWHIAAYRLLSTTVGGVLAVGASYVLWPRWESVQFPHMLSKALRANKNFLLQISHELEFKTGFHSRVVADQRKAEIENSNTQESMKRSLLEPKRLPLKVAHAQALINHNKKLTQELTAFAAFLPKLSADFNFPEAIQGITLTAQLLEKLAAAVERNQPLGSRIDFDLPLMAIEAKIHQIQPPFFSNQPVLEISEKAYLAHEITHSSIKRIVGEIKAMARLIA